MSVNYEIKNPIIETTMMAIGAKIGPALPTGWSFLLMIFELGEGSANFYISKADRSDVVKMLGEWIARQPEAQTGEAPLGLNPNHPVTKAAQNNWHKVLAVVLHKFADVIGDDIVITSADIDAMTAGYAGMPSVVIDDRSDGLHLRIVDEAEGRELAKRAGGLPS